MLVGKGIIDGVGKRVGDVVGVGAVIVGVGVAVGEL
jgi:hypothetical protein